MLRVMVIVIALTGIVRADTSADARKLSETTLGRYDREIEHRSIFLKISDLLDEALLENCKYARGHFLEAKRAFDKAPPDTEPAVLQDYLEEMERTSKKLNHSIDDYQAEAKTNMLKVVGCLALVVLLLFGGAIWAIIKRRGARYVPGRR